MNKNDARVIATKKFLKESLINILSEKKLNEVTIKEVCEAAQINRATFYSHYKSVNELYDAIRREFMEIMYGFIIRANMANTYEGKMEVYEEFLTFVDKESNLFTLLFNNSSGFEKYDSNYNTLKGNLFFNIKDDDFIKKYEDYISNFFVYAGGAILNTWIDNGKKEDYKTIADIMIRLILSGISLDGKNKK